MKHLPLLLLSVFSLAAPAVAQTPTIGIDKPPTPEEQARLDNMCGQNEVKIVVAENTSELPAYKLRGWVVIDLSAAKGYYISPKKFACSYLFSWSDGSERRSVYTESQNSMRQSIVEVMPETEWLAKRKKSK